MLKVSAIVLLEFGSFAVLTLHFTNMALQSLSKWRWRQSFSTVQQKFKKKKKNLTIQRTRIKITNMANGIFHVSMNCPKDTPLESGGRQLLIASL